MLISVIIPVYNGATFIRRAIDSVLNQTYKDFELIIVDDCSTDNTIDIINSYTDKRIKLVQLQENKGAGIARQEGIKYANGEFITFLDSDDALRWDFLEANVILQSQHDADIVYTSFIIRYDQQYVDQIIPAGDFIMEESATIQMYFS